MDITTNDDWQWVDGSYPGIAFATTSDPRVLAIIQREEDWGGGHIDGDAYAPAWYFDTWRNKINKAGSTFRDNASTRIMERLHEARTEFRHRRMHSDVMERWLKIFHDTVFEQVKSSIDSETQVIILSTPTWREHVGGVAGDPLRKDALGEDVEAWEAALGGDIFGVGWATNVGRVMDQEEELNPTDGVWTVNLECWGFLGEQYAKDSAADFEHGDPDLDPMLDFDEPGFVEHSDRMADAS